MTFGFCRGHVQGGPEVAKGLDLSWEEQVDKWPGLAQQGEPREGHAAASKSGFRHGTFRDAS